MEAEPRSDLTRTTLQLLFIGVLAAGCFWILRPFLTSLLWAATIVVASWPLYQRMLARLGGRRRIAVAAMTLAMLLVVVVPLYLAITTIVEHVDRVADWSHLVESFAVPPPPAWIGEIPLVGDKIAATWKDIAAASPEELSLRLLPYARMVVAWFAAQAGSAGLMLVDFLLTVVIAAILYANGEQVAAGVGRFANRLAGVQGEDAVHLAAQAVRAVALGVVVTALVQSCLGGIGLKVAGVPFSAILTAVMFILGVAQVGPGPVLIPVVIWAYWHYGVVWGSAMLVWCVIVGIMDNFLRPVLIRRGADLPMLLIFAGVIGGLIAFGVVGLFIGPVVLAVAYTLLGAWVEDGVRPPRVRRAGA